jgi:hypothetical protein
VKLEEFEKWKKKELRQRIDDCFEHAQETEAEDRLAVLLEAQFYTRELEHRNDSWVSIRDFILEILVIALIGWEIHMGYKQESQQSDLFEKQQQVLTNLEQSSAATATALESLKSTTETMNAAIQDEANLNYRVSVDVSFDAGSKRVIIVNKGRSDVWLWGDKLGNEKAVFEKAPRAVSSGGFYYILGDTFYDEMSKTPKDASVTVPFSLFLRNGNGKDYVVTSQFNAVWQKDTLNIHTQTISITQRDWSQKP